MQEVLQTAEQEIYSIAVEKDDIPVILAQDHAARTLNSYERRLKQGNNRGILTRFARLNKIINTGFNPKELIVLSEKTGQGKMSFAMNLVVDIAIKQKIPTLYINTEMNEDQIDNRFAAMLTNNLSMTYERIAKTELSDSEMSEFVEALDKMNSSGFASKTIPILTISEVISVARRYKLQHKMKVLVLDYIGRMDTQDGRKQEWEVLKLIAKKLKTLAQEIDITFIMLAQLNDNGKLEGSKGMKNECDLSMQLHQMPEEEISGNGNWANYYLGIDKNRNGKCGKIKLRFYGENFLFVGDEHTPETARVDRDESEQNEYSQAYRRTNQNSRRS